MKTKSSFEVLSAILAGAAALCIVGAMCAHAQPATLRISTAPGGTNVNVQWNTGGTLQFAPTPSGPWTTVTSGVSVVSSNTVLASSPARFFRVVDNGVAGTPVPLFPNALSAPLQVLGASVQLLPAPVPAGNARLIMSLAPGQLSSSNVLTLLINNYLTLLRDDGVFPDQVANDGNFSAVVNVDPAELDALNSEITNLPVDQQITEVFSGRSVIGTNALQTFPSATFFAGETVIFFTNCAFCNFPQPCAGSPKAYNPAKTLMITDLSVVQDPTRTWDPVGGGTKMGAWTFGKLMTDMANTPVTGISASDFVLRWLQSWQFNQTINGDTVLADTNVQAQVVTPWLNASAGEGFPQGTLDLSIAPFRLLAIVNRVDLRANSTYGGTTPNKGAPGGEARFVFGVLDPFGNQLPFTVILEYAVPKSSCLDLRNWGMQWASLNSLPFNFPPLNPSFNIALQAITDQFATANADPSRLPNKSAIHQVRSNDFLSVSNGNTIVGWNLRQFNIDTGSGGSPGYLIESPVAGTPALSLNNSATLNMFLLGIPSPGTFCPGPFPVPSISIPTLYTGNPFLGGDAPEGFGMFWDSDTPVGLAGGQLCVRHIMSLNTCNACHTQETGTSFTHVGTRDFNSTALLSGFLTGIAVNDPDPANSAVVYNYADLARRVQDLNSLVICPCFMQVAFFPILTVH